MEAIDVLPPCRNGEERNACVSTTPGFHIRHPPPPHELRDSLTSDAELFQTIHMGPVTVDEARWRLTVDGLVERPFTLTLDMVKKLPRTEVTAFHECYGSPLKPPTQNLWRVGNVIWAGVRLRLLLAYAKPLPAANYVWSDGLDHGEFAGFHADRYQKDLPLTKAMCDEVLVAYEMNGQLLDSLRGGPVRLVVPGWFGTNSTKWLCRLSLQAERPSSVYTTKLYNEQVLGSDVLAMRPVWQVEPNSMIVSPASGKVVNCSALTVMGWAWCDEEVATVSVSCSEGADWQTASLARRTGHEWQKFEARLALLPGTCTLMVRATSISGVQQPLRGRRNHVHTITVTSG